MSPDGKYLVTLAENGITFWEWNSDPITAFVPGTYGEVSSPADGRVVVLTWPSGDVMSFDIHTQLPILQMKLGAGESVMALSRDGTRIAIKSGDGNVLVRDVNSWANVIAVMRLQSGPNGAEDDLSSGQFSSDGRRLA